MEIHKYTDIIGRTLDWNGVYEGRMVYLTEDGCRIPQTAAQAAKSKYLVAWKQNNIPMPMYEPYPSYTWALRYGFDRTNNTPFSATVYTTYPGLESTEQAIPSGQAVLLYTAGEFTVTSGNWVYDASMVEGTELEVETTTGKLTTLSGGTAIAVCTKVNTNGDLQFRTYFE
jgi:hypothetical protein